MRRSLSEHAVFGTSVAALSDHRKRIGSARKRKSAVNRRLATRWCGLATRRYGRAATRQKPGESILFVIIRDSFDLWFFTRDLEPSLGCVTRSLLGLVLRLKGIGAARSDL
jgi:hypothetical protein